MKKWSPSNICTLQLAEVFSCHVRPLYTETSISILTGPVSLLPTAAKRLIELNQRRQFVSLRLGQVQFS